MNHQQAVAIDHKEIRGINAKHLMWLIGTLCSILVSIMATYYSITYKIDKGNDRIEQVQSDIQTLKTSKEIQDAQIKALNLQMNALELRIVRLETVMGLKTDNKPGF